MPFPSPRPAQVAPTYKESAPPPRRPDIATSLSSHPGDHGAAAGLSFDERLFELDPFSLPGATFDVIRISPASVNGRRIDGFQRTLKAGASLASLQATFGGGLYRIIARRGAEAARIADIQVAGEPIDSAYGPPPRREEDERDSRLATVETVQRMLEAANRPVPALEDEDEEDESDALDREVARVQRILDVADKIRERTPAAAGGESSPTVAVLTQLFARIPAGFWESLGHAAVAFADRTTEKWKAPTVATIGRRAPPVAASTATATAPDVEEGGVTAADEAAAADVPQPSPLPPALVNALASELLSSAGPSGVPAPREIGARILEIFPQVREFLNARALVAIYRAVKEAAFTEYQRTTGEAPSEATRREVRDRFDAVVVYLQTHAAAPPNGNAPPSN